MSDEMVIRHGSPTLAGLKTGNLFSCTYTGKTQLQKALRSLNRRLASKGGLKKCSTSLVIREMQIKTTLRFHLTPVRMAKIKNSGDSRCSRRCGDRGTLLHCWYRS